MPLTETLSKSVGAVVHGVTRDNLLTDPDLPAWTLDALERHGALVFRGLHLDDETQVAFSRTLGTVECLGTGPMPEIFKVTLDPAKNPAATYLRGTFDWHIDGCTDDTPIMATMLNAIAVADAGGETDFINAYAAYDRLDDDEKERLAELRVVHTIAATQRRIFPDPTPEQVEMWNSRPAKTHPLVWRHRSGRRSLVLGATADYIVGMDPAEGAALLDDLLERSTTPEHVYRHEWTVGDLVLWDNRGVLHRATAYDPDSPRLMHRTTFTGDEPISA